MRELQCIPTANQTLTGMFLPRTGEPVKGCLSGNLHATLEPFPHEPLKYEGDYEIYPTNDEQILLTKDKIMTDNITIHGVNENEYYEEINETGGKTVVIGGN